MNLLALIGHDTLLKRTSAHQGGEYSGPCPLCCCGTDRFKVWPRLERWACLGPSAGRNGCDRGGDAIQYLRERDGLTFKEACERLNIPINTDATRSQRPYVAETVKEMISVAPLSPPNPTWQAHACGWAARAEAMLWQQEGERARSYLNRRGLHDETIRAFHLGYNPKDSYEEHTQWGLPQPDNGAKHVWIPRGIIFPWYIGGSMWRLNVRRPLTPTQIAAGETKYIGPAGFANALYNADSLSGSEKPVILVEGEIDALTIIQACSSEVAVVATGSTAGGRRNEWVAKLAVSPLVLVAFDADPGSKTEAPSGGDRAAAWWLNILPNARRWRPLIHDVNSLPDLDEVRCWVLRGLAWAKPQVR